MEPSPIIELLVIGAIAGFFIGHLIKKLFHLALIIGAFTLLFTYMVHTKALNLNFEELGATITGYADVFLGRLGFATLVASTPFAGSFVVGLFLGFMKS